MADEAIGAAVKKIGLLDTLVDWGRKLPSTKKLVQTVDDRVNTALHKLGMDFESLNMLPAYRDDMIELTEKFSGCTDGEAAELAKTVIENMELTRNGVGDNVKYEIGDGIVQRVVAKGYDETQARNAVQELEAYQFDLEKIADHIVERVIDRQVSVRGIEDAIKNPLKTLPVKYDGSGRPSYKVIGEMVSVVINPINGNLVTVHKTGSKLAEKLKGVK